MSTELRNMDDFGERLRHERRRLGMSQTDFGSAGGVRKQAQLHYENGSRYPDADYLSRIAQIGVDVDYLLSGESSSVGELVLSVEEQRLVTGFRELKAREKRGVLALVGAIIAPAPGEPDDGVER